MYEYQTLILSNERSDSTHHLFLGFLLVKSDHVTYSGDVGSGELTFFCPLKKIGRLQKINFKMADSQ